MNLGTAARQSTFESKYSAKTANTKDSVAKQKSNEAQRYWRSLIDKGRQVRTTTTKH